MSCSIADFGEGCAWLCGTGCIRLEKETQSVQYCFSAEAVGFCLMGIGLLLLVVRYPGRKQFVTAEELREKSFLTCGSV
ncbi:unnamed protein product [Rhodiola kirilowii]